MRLGAWQVAIMLAGLGNWLVATAQECAPISGVEKISGKQVIFLGELHGTKEAPKFVADLVCILLKSKREIALALEIPGNYQAPLSSALADPSEDAALSGIEKLAFWDSAMQDGRRSAAYMSLLHAAWKLQKEHPKLKVVAMDSPLATSATERDKYMADQIRKILDVDKRYTVVAFAGNVHARRQKGTSWNKEFVPAGYFLRDVDSVSLNMDYTAGTAWNCNDAGCGVHPVSKAPASGKASIPRIELTQDDPNYDGQFVLGEITASLPVRQAKQK